MKIALIGNPNTGKSTLFNALTGLRQHVGNFPGITTDKKVGVLEVNGENHELIDLPGTYSLYPKSADEQVVYNALSNPAADGFPEVLMVVVDVTNLERNLLLFSQVYDLGLPTLMVLTMTDLAAKQHITYELEVLAKLFPQAGIVESKGPAIEIKKRIKASIASLPSRNSEVTGVIEVSNEANQIMDTQQRFERIRSGLASMQKQSIPKPNK